MPPDQTLHLINPLRNPFGGSEWRVLEMRRLLEPHVSLEVWGARNAAPSLLHAAGARILRPVLGQFPRRGTLVFVGTYFSVGRWVALAAPRRVVVIFNTDQPRWLRDNLARIARSGCQAEVVYTSHALRERHRGHGPVVESPIDMAHFTWRDPAHLAPRSFTVGRHSRDEPTKHHADDPALYRRLAAAGVRVRLMGATCLAGALAGTPGVEILPEGAMPALAFLRSLDAFVYRTSATWYEAFGRVVFEAMAAGVPVTCAPEGGYAGYLDAGRDALVATGSDALFDAVMAMRDDPALRVRLSRNARRRAESVQRHAGDAMLRLLAGRACGSDDGLSAPCRAARGGSAALGAGSPQAARANGAGRA